MQRERVPILVVDTKDPVTQVLYAVGFGIMAALVICFVLAAMRQDGANVTPAIQSKPVVIRPIPSLQEDSPIGPVRV